MPAGRPLRSVGSPEPASSGDAWIDGWAPDVDLPSRALVRPELFDLLEQPDADVTVVCAPVGYGKSTLVRQWLERNGAPACAWVPAGSHATAADLADAVGRGLAALGAAVSGDTWRPGSPPASSQLPHWLRGMPESVLVVDGVRGAEALGGFEGLADAVASAAGCGLRVVATTRPRPSDDLARLVARGSAALVSEDDLALDLDGATALMTAVVGRAVDPAQVEPLLDELGGWPAGLAVVARGWQRATTDAAMAQRLRSSLEVVDEYLIGEVLDPLDPEVRSLAAELGHLPVLAPDLCDRLLGRRDGAEVLGALRVGGSMVSPGQNDGWLQVHPALRGAVRRRVHDGGVERRTATDDAAVEWYLARGEPIHAVRLLAGSGRWDAVRGTVIDNIPTLLRTGQVPQLARILRDAPLDFFQTDLKHVSQYAFFELATGNVNRALQLLNEMERFFTPADMLGPNLVRSTAGVYVADPRPAMLAGESALRTVEEFREKIDRSSRYYIGASSDQYRMMLQGHLLILGALTGEWRRVQQHQQELPPEITSKMAPSPLIGALGNRATHLALAGQLVDAERAAEEAMAAAVEGDLFIEPATAPARFARGEARRAAGGWKDAIADLAVARDKADANRRVLLSAVASACLAHAHLDGGAPDLAAEVLDEVPVALFDRARTVAGLLAAAQARVLVAQGDPAAALRALRTARLTPMTASESVAIGLHTQDLALAEAVLAQWPVDPTVDNRVRRGLAVAAVGIATGRSEGAEAIGRTLSLAAKHGLVQPLVRLAEPLAPLLRAAARKGRSAGARLAQDVLSTTPAAPLPGRQLAVMQLLEEGLTLPEIAAELHISVSMVKKHTRAIYRALGASNRVEAVQAWASGPSSG